MDKKAKAAICFGLILIIAGIFMLNYNVGESAIKDFLSGLILGIGCTVTLVGVYITIRTLAEKDGTQKK